MFGVPQVAGVRYHERGDRPQPRDNFSRFFEPTHVRVARSENAIRLGECWIFLDREAEFRRSLIEASSGEMRAA